MPDPNATPPARGLLHTLRARYDSAALLPPQPACDPKPHDALAWQSLLDWCLTGSGPGTLPLFSPLLQPRALPLVDTRFSIATLEGPGADALATLLALERDGSLQLLACNGAAGRIRLRAATKLHDLAWWRPRQRSDAWDSGSLIASEAGLQALARFAPRRATLVVAQQLGDAHLQRAVATFQRRQAGFAHPVRLLIVGSPGAPVLQGLSSQAIRCNG